MVVTARSEDSSTYRRGKVKIAVAMSGGVDSSVAAALLKEAGHEVSGVTMRLTDDTHAGTYAADTARRLGLPHRVIDLRDIFTATIIDYFCGEYGRGRTPNPCILCNRYIKFGALWEAAKKAGAEMLATGHYARIEKSRRGKYILKRGRDGNKDQSYFLCQLTQEQLSRTMFPVGNLTKDEVRKIAREMGLPAMARPESQEICFIPDNDLAGFLRAHTPEAERPGAILDEAGRAIGRHRGIASYTIGQRRGLGIASTEPLYVTGIVAEQNTVIAGTRDRTYGTELTAGGLNWIGVGAPEHPLEVKAKIRYRHAEAAATVTPVGDETVRVIFKEPQAAITPGQAVVFYDGARVMGGGTIAKKGG
jgi:tRNA-specific 2-thiouridylase